jgi:hypothetical protein
MRQKTEYKLPSNSRWIGEAGGHTREQLLSQAARQQAREDPKTKTRFCLPRSGRFAAGSETTNQSLGFFFGTVWNDGIDSSILTHGNLSSR